MSIDNTEPTTKPPRELKFRAWDAKGEYSVGKPKMHEDITGMNIFDCLWNDDDFPIMQHTGRKDFNGKDIYESDIVEYAGYYLTVSYCEEETGFIVNHPNDLTFVGDMGNCVVVGNIHQNPELLEGVESE